MFHGESNVHSTMTKAMDTKPVLERKKHKSSGIQNKLTRMQFGNQIQIARDQTIFSKFGNDSII